MLFLDAIYGSDTHVCAQCPDGARPSKRLTPATERQASAADRLEAGDLICPTCAAALTADADALDEIVLDRETAQNDDGDDIAAALDARGYHNTARAVRESSGTERTEALDAIRHALPEIAREVAA